MNRIFGAALFIALLGGVWNLFALGMSWFGFHLPVVEG